MNEGDFMKLLNCSTEEEVLDKVKSWSSDLSDREHLVRSIILDIQASLEGLLKNLLYHILFTVLFQGENNESNERAKDNLDKTITKMNFSSVYRILEPILDAYPARDLSSIPALNDLRNRVAHSQNLSDVTYNGRNPFTNADSLAQVYLDAWAARDALRKFYKNMIEEPLAKSAYYAQFFHKNFDKLKNESEDNLESAS